MQQIHKKIILSFNHINLFYKTIKILMNFIFLVFFSLLASCNLVTNKKEIFENKKFLEKQKECNKTLKNYIKYKHVISYRDKISTLLKKSGVNLNDILKLIQADKNLNNIKIGQKIFWKVNQLNQLINLKWYISEFQQKRYEKYKNQYIKCKSDSFLEKKIIYIKKNSNFFKSAYKSGLSQYEINSIVKAIEWQVNFHKLKVGSNFILIFLNKKKNNKKNKKILLGIKLNNLDKEYFSIKAFNGKFYDANGFNISQESINFSFLKKYRISSPFDLHRLHPITHRVSRHLGVDLAMPQGTPVLAASKGIIVKAEFNKTAGFYISLKNKNYYTTRYMHLKKILVKVGQKIKKGQKIGLSGNTGRTTGPHLHYEIWIDNHAINPINAEHIFSKDLTKNERIKYLKESKKILLQLK